MRALLGLLVLGSLFVMAASWQNRTTEGLRDQRAQRFGIPSDATRSPEGWSRLVLGRPSGADPIPLPEPAVAPTPIGQDPTPSEEPPIHTVPPDFEYVVRPNEVLGVICQNYYDERPLARVVEAVAIYNDLPSADAIRSGDVLLLPDASVLFGPR